MHRAVALLALLALLAAAPLAAQIGTPTKSSDIMLDRADQFTGARTVFSKSAALRRLSDRPGDHFEINLAWVSKGSEQRLDLIGTLSGDDWFFVPQGENLILLVDSAKVTFSGDGSAGSRNVKSDTGYGIVSESAGWTISWDMARALAGAKSVKLRVAGTKMTTDWELSQKDRDLIGRFVTSFGPKTP